MSTGPTLKQLIGKVVLIGITRVTHEGALIDQQQYVGTFESMDQVIHVRLRSGEDLTLPPDLAAFRKAARGAYRLRSTGEEVENTDFTATWTVHAPAPQNR